MCRVLRSWWWDPTPVSIRRQRIVKNLDTSQDKIETTKVSVIAGKQACYRPNFCGTRDTYNTGLSEMTLEGIRRTPIFGLCGSLVCLRVGWLCVSSQRTPSGARERNSGVKRQIRKYYTSGNMGREALGCVPWSRMGYLKGIKPPSLHLTIFPLPLFHSILPPFIR